jgi:tetratricopeptide (TPR) repeat protein
VSLVRALAAAGRAEEARPIIDAGVAQNPTDATLRDLQWRVHLAVKDWAGAVAIGDSLVALDSAAATPDYFVRMTAALEAAGQAASAVEMVARGVARFPVNDDLAVLHVQLLRRTGDSRGALDAVNRLVERNPKAPNAWLQKARAEADLAEDAATIIATLERGVEHGEARSAVSGYAATLGQAALRAGTAAKGADELRTAVRYFKLAESVQAGDTTAYLLGASSLSLGQRLYGEARTARRCDLAKEMQQALVDAQINLPKGGRAFPENARASLAKLAEVLPYSEPLAKELCR